MSAPPVVLAITGASGAPYAVRLLEVLARNRVPVWLIVSGHGCLRLLQAETGIGDEAALRQATGGDWGAITVFADDDRGARPASGSARTAGMVICPCSMGTVSAVAHGSSRSLVERAADVTLKERRRLILVPARDTILAGASQADVILTMKTEQMTTVQAFAEARGRMVYSLKEFAGAGGDIDDPYGHDDNRYRACRDEIRRCLERSLPRLLVRPSAPDVTMVRHLLDGPKHAAVPHSPLAPTHTEDQR